MLLDPGERLIAGTVHVVLELEVGLPCAVDGLVDLGAGDVGALEAAAALGGVLLALDRDELVEPALQLVLLVVRDEGVHELDLLVSELVDVQAERLRVAHDDRAVVVVGGAAVLLALPADAGHPDEVGVFGQQVHDVAVGELGRVAHALGGHGLDAGVVGLAARLVAHDDREAQLGEERVPERVVLVHVERARDAHRAARGLVGGQDLAVEDEVVLELEVGFPCVVDGLVDLGTRDVGSLEAAAPLRSLLLTLDRDERRRRRRRRGRGRAGPHRRRPWCRRCRDG